MNDRVKGASSVDMWWCDFSRSTEDQRSEWEAATTDEATPNHNAVAAQNLIRLAVLSGDDSCRDKADRLIAAVAPIIAENLYMHLATVQRESGKLADAAATYRKLLERWPDNAGATNDLANVLSELGDGGCQEERADRDLRFERLADTRDHADARHRIAA